MGKPIANSRIVAVQVAQQVRQHGRSLGLCLEPELQRLTNPQDRKFASALVHALLRFWPRWEAIGSQLLNKPLKRRDFDVHTLLLLGIAQLEELQVAPHAAVAESVSCARQLGKPWAASLINASLRRFQRERDALLAVALRGEEARYAHPAWLIKTVQAAWPESWQSLLEANNQQPPLWLRVNQLRCTVEDYMAALRAAEFKPLTDARLPHALRLDEGADVTALPGFDEGWFSVQDGSAQFAAPLLDSSQPCRVLDACAAPGGKSAHLIERLPAGSEVIALDSDASRMQRLEQNMRRLQLTCRIQIAPAEEISRWWDGVPFDRILLDAPCSGTGVIRRHPDIKWLRQPEDIPVLVETQLRLLRALWPLLAPGGMLAYTTCSVLPQENADVIGQFLAATADADVRDPGADYGVVSGQGRQRLPGDAGMDGFYYALLAKRALNAGA
jgi:16S rRNA (cytosine967-C5)-methyltransferase